MLPVVAHIDCVLARASSVYLTLDWVETRAERRGRSTTSRARRKMGKGGGCHIVMLPDGIFRASISMSATCSHG